MGRLSRLSCVAVAGLSLVTVAAPARAQSQSGVPAWRPIGGVAVSSTGPDRWIETSIGIERPRSPRWQPGRVELSRLERPGIRDHQITLGFNGPDGWTAELRAAPEATVLASAGARIGRTTTVTTASGLKLVPGLALDARHWDAGTLVALAPSVEIYPASARWRGVVSGQAGVFDGRGTGGGFAMLAVPAARGLELWALAGAGREVEAGKPLDTTTLSAGIAVPVADGQRLELGLARETRGDRWERSGLQLRLGRQF